MFLRRVIRLPSVAIRRKKTDTKAPAAVDSQQKEIDSQKNAALECIKESQLVPQEKKVYAPLRSVNVTVIGACNPKAYYLCTLLKLNPLIKELRMYDESSMLRGIHLDIAQISSTARVIPFIGENQLKRALYKTHLVVVTAPVEPKETSRTSNSAELFNANKTKIKALCQECIAHCPDAVLVITANPVNSMVPLIAEMFQQQGVMCPTRIIGSMALEEMRSRVLTAVSLGLDPATVHVDVIGGGTPQTAIPVVSGTKPGGTYLRNEFPKIKRVLENMTKEVFLNKKQSPSVSEAYAQSHLISNVIKGLCGKPHPITSVFIRTSTLYGIKYLSVPVQFGLFGVYKNLGLPALSNHEIEALDSVLYELQEDITRGEEWAKPKDVINDDFYEPVEETGSSIAPTLPRCSHYTM
ncbi:hypothetical protein O3M35_008710 [Rhynocoris fuscipes]|uniref:Malate dehydrogenase, mitochondrial n=1 Tax=Rhynocoris fuscipes TaxID=488301 RepID=A0AAW1D789_9HEMI